MHHEKRKRLILLLARLIREFNELPEDLAGCYPLLGRLLEKSGFIDCPYYLDRNPDVGDAGLDAARHYVEFGFREGRLPAPGLERAIRLLPVYEASECGNLQRFLELLLARVIMSTDTDGSAPESRILRQGSYEASYDLPIHVQWAITNMCNYHCSYCNYQGRRKKFDSGNFHPLDALVNAVDNLASLNRPAYEIVLLGGEPTTHPSLLDLTRSIDERLNRRLARLTIVTNGSRPAGYFNQLSDLASRVYTQIMISIHMEHARVKDIYSLVETIDPAIELNLLLMLHPLKLEYAGEIISCLCNLRKNHGFNLTLQTIYGPPDYTTPDQRYPGAFNEWQNAQQEKIWDSVRSSPIIMTGRHEQCFHTFWEIAQNGKVILYPDGDRALYYQNGWLNFKGMHCIGGVHTAYIDEHGNLSPSSCSEFTVKINIFEKGMLNNTNFMETVPCSLGACVCSDNDVAMKFASKEEARNFIRLAKARQERLFSQDPHKCS